jgi:hypothetical protein
VFGVGCWLFDVFRSEIPPIRSLRLSPFATGMAMRIPGRPSHNLNEIAQQSPRLPLLERFKKLCGHSGRGFLGFGEALAKEHARSGL